MKKIIRQTTFALTATILLAACGSKKKTGEESTGKTETTTAAAPAATLKPLDLSAQGIPLSIQAPEGATVTQEEGGNVVVAKDRFNVVIKEDKYGDENATAEQAKETLLQEDTQSLNDPGM